MSTLVESLLSTIRDDLDSRFKDDPQGEYRVVYCGPPMPILANMLEVVLEAGGLPMGTTETPLSPVLLPTRAFENDPEKLSGSGQCSDSHLVRVRNSASIKQYLMLLPTGHPLNDSMDTTIDRIGIPPKESRLACRTPYFGALLEQAMRRRNADRAKDFVSLASGVLKRELLELDQETNNSGRQWELLQEVFDRKMLNSTPNESVLAILGLCSCGEGQLDFDLHYGVLVRLAELLESEGIGPAFEILRERASEGLHNALDQCLVHIRSRCRVGSDFKEAPSSCYSPIRGCNAGAEIPGWWRVLTLDIWDELLDTPADVKPATDLEVRCTNRVMPSGSGLPVVVQSSPVFEINFTNPDDARSVAVCRRVGRKQPEDLGTVEVAGETYEWKDSDPPEHNSYLEYIFQASEFNGAESKPVKIKLIALDVYEIGVVPYCRNASKMTTFRAGKKRRAAGQDPVFECSLELHGMGMHQIDLYLAGGFCLEKEMVGYEVSSEKDDKVVKPINISGEQHAVCIIETDEECHYLFKAGLENADREYKINIQADDDVPIGAESEFDRLVIENQKKFRNERGGATVEPPSARCSDLQRWILSSEESYRPVIIGPDFEECWVQPNWEGDALISRFELLQDPRPAQNELNPPDRFLELRSSVLKLLGDDGDGDLMLIEEIGLSNLLVGSEEFAELIREYANTYAEWLENDYERAVWCDIALACKADKAGASLNPSPYALLLNPFHPLRLAWHCQAQAVMRESIDKHVPCPAASTLDPGSVPDCLALPITETSGETKHTGFLAVGSSSDYWQVMWNTSQLEDLAASEFESLFGPWFGITVDGLASGFSAEQVKRSIDEMTRIYSAKSIFRLLVASDCQGTSSCNEGIESWAASHVGPDNDPWYGEGATRIDVVDTRALSSQPMESRVAKMTEDSGGMLKWFSTAQPEIVADLAVLAHLGTANPKLEHHKLRAPVDKTGLLRWRVRRQTGDGGKFIAETRVGKYVHGEDGLAGPLAEISSRLDSEFSELADAHVFAPNLPTLSNTLSRARYCAVSSSSLDPACFFGQMKNFYLWDYDLPSYSRRAGENNGYYLLAAETPAMTEAISAALDVLQKNAVANRDSELISTLLVEIASRGMPTLKNLTSGGSTALGEVGMLAALRVLQGDFIEGRPTPGVVPVRVADEGKLTLVIPIDPFAGHFDALRRSMEGQNLQRPDLLIASIQFEGENRPASIKLTPVEVKARSGAMPTADRVNALQQASSFSKFLELLRKRGSEYELWMLAWKHLVCSWLDYGFRVYGQLPEFRHDPDWCVCHQNTLSAVLDESMPIEIDTAGRLVVIDSSNHSDLLDIDGDGFKETLLVSHANAHEFATSPAESIIPNVVSQLGNWNSFSRSVTQTKTAVKPVAAQEGSVNTTTQNESPPSVDEAEVPPLVSSEQVSQKCGDSRECDGTPTEEPAAHSGMAGAVASGSEGPPPLTNMGVDFEVGRTIGGFSQRDVFYHPSNTALNQMNIGVVGDLGTGKTQWLQGVLYNLSQSAESNRGISPNILIFDYKKDYSKSMFVENAGATVIKPVNIPLNLFDTTYCTNEINPRLERTRFFIDVLMRIFGGLGNVQSYRIKTSVKEAFEQAELNGLGAPTINDVLGKYRDACGNKPDSVLSIIENLVDNQLFVDSHDKAVSFKEFFDGVVVIDLGALGADDQTKNMLVAIFLNLFFEYMLNVEKKPVIDTPSNKLRALDSFLLVDEADNIMKYEFDVLKKILLQGREFGVGVILASQFPSHFKTARENYAESLRTWAIHRVPDISAAQLQSMGFTGIDNTTTERIKQLDVHQCLYRSLSDEAEFIRGHPLFEIVKNRDAQK